MSSGILFVCTANMCRSPIAERVAQLMLGKTLGGVRAPLPTASAGTHAQSGQPMHPYAAAVLIERGADPSRFRSRILTASIIGSAGLVLTAGREQRAACVALVPGAVRHTFTLRQFGRLAAAADGVGSPRAGAPRHADRLDIALDATARARGGLQPVEPDEDDLDDPIGEPMAAFRRCAATIEAALDPVARLIAACE